MDRDWAEGFAAGWLEAWNQHDLEQILSHFASDIVFTSPMATALLQDSDGIIRGKTALREYWSEGLRLIPDLHFELVDLYVGVNTLVIHYRNQRGDLVNEVLTFAGPLVIEGHGTYRGG
jgi:ketosteroid isomerase-like protein